MLEGRIGDDFKYTRTVEGKVFATFTLNVKSFDKELRDSTENKEYITIKIMVFDHKLVQYLQKVDACNGCIANVFGRLNSYQSERKGVKFWQNDVVVRDINIIKIN